MKNTILILISLMFLTGCEKEVTSLQDRGGVKYEVNSEVGFTGKYVEYSENGQKKLENHYKNGKLDGLSTFWHESGDKQWEGYFRDGKKEGFVSGWYENGQRIFEGNYRDGKEEGLFFYWYENGQKKWEIINKNGTEVTRDEWDKEGIFTKTEAYKWGK